MEKNNQVGNGKNFLQKFPTFWICLMILSGIGGFVLNSVGLPDRMTKQERATIEIIKELEKQKSDIASFSEIQKLNLCKLDQIAKDLSYVKGILDSRKNP